jgi:hypothetical protein
VEFVLSQSRVEGGVGSALELEALVVGQTVFGDRVPSVVDGVLFDDVHWCEEDSWKKVDLVEGKGEAVAMRYIVLDECAEEVVV